MPTEAQAWAHGWYELKRLNCTIATLHQLLAKQEAEAAEWKSKYMALLSHVKGPAIDDDTSPPGGE